jgi:hypothetical protein
MRRCIPWELAQAPKTILFEKGDVSEFELLGLLRFISSWLASVFAYP